MPGTLFLLAGNFRMQNAAIIISCLKMMVDANNVRMKQKMASTKLFRFLLLMACLPVMCLLTNAARGGVIFTNLVSFTGVGGACPGAGSY